MALSTQYILTSQKKYTQTLSAGSFTELIVDTFLTGLSTPLFMSTGLPILMLAFFATVQTRGTFAAFLKSVANVVTPCTGWFGRVYWCIFHWKNTGMNMSLWMPLIPNLSVFNYDKCVDRRSKWWIWTDTKQWNGRETRVLSLYNTTRQVHIYLIVHDLTTYTLRSTNNKLINKYSTVSMKYNWEGRKKTFYWRWYPHHTMIKYDVCVLSLQQ